MFFTKTKSTIPEKESLKSKRDPNTEWLKKKGKKKKKNHQDIKLEITVNK